MIADNSGISPKQPNSAQHDILWQPKRIRRQATASVIGQRGRRLPSLSAVRDKYTRGPILASIIVTTHYGW